MIWNWQHPDWPNFRYHPATLQGLEASFLYQAGLLRGVYQHLSTAEQNALTVQVISEEGLKTSEIEGAYLNRDSLQSSIKRHFGIPTDHRKIPPAEAGLAEMMVELHRTFATPLSHEILFHWHLLLTQGRWDLHDVGRYRSQTEPMQIVSGSLAHPKVHFEAPPAERVTEEMECFIHWFNQTAPDGAQPLPALTRASIAHWYFESIHPFEDGNGRLGRALVEKILSQQLQQPTLIALSRTIERHKKKYYQQLAHHNRRLDLDNWLLYFGETILEAQGETQTLIQFLVFKAQLYDRLDKLLNERQRKVLARLFDAGPAGFEGGLSAENYIAITKTSRATATRDLQDLVAYGALKQEGRLKSTRYALSQY